MSIRTIKQEIRDGESFEIPGTNHKALILLSFIGTASACLSFWDLSGLQHIISDHNYYSLGSIVDGKISVTKVKGENYIITNKQGETVTVIGTLILVD